MKYFGIMLSVFGLDTVTKIWARKKLPLGGKTEIIKDKFYFRRIKNDGMAYNILERYISQADSSVGASLLSV